MEMDSIIARLCEMASYCDTEIDAKACTEAAGILFALMDSGCKTAEEAKDLVHDYNALAKQYSGLRNIYRAFRAGDISRDRAGEEKRHLRREWEKAKEAEALERKLLDFHVRLIRGAEQAVTRCRKEPTAENALYLCDVLDGFERPEVGTWS